MIFMKFKMLNGRKSKRVEEFLIRRGAKKSTLDGCVFLICNSHIWVCAKDCYNEEFEYWNVMGAGMMVLLDFEKMVPAERGIDSLKGLK
jgi:hypothetical protein